MLAVVQNWPYVIFAFRVLHWIFLINSILSVAEELYFHLYCDQYCVQHDWHLWVWSPVSADAHLSTWPTCVAPSVVVSGSQNLSLGWLDTWAVQPMSHYVPLRPLGSHEAVTPSGKLCLSFSVLLFLNTGALTTVQKLILTAKLVTPSVPLALPFQLWKKRTSLKCIDYRLQYGNSNMGTY